MKSIWYEVTWLIAGIAVLGFITLAIISRVEKGVENTKKFRNTHSTTLPKD